MMRVRIDPDGNAQIKTLCFWCRKEVWLELTIKDLIVKQQPCPLCGGKMAGIVALDASPDEQARMINRAEKAGLN